VFSALERIFSAKTGAKIQEDFTNCFNSGSGVLFKEFSQLNSQATAANSAKSNITSRTGNRREDEKNILSMVLRRIREQVCTEFSSLYMSQENDKNLSKDCLNKLADAFSFDIIICDNNSKPVKSEKKKRVFASPLVIYSNENNAYVRYTRAQARLFAEDEATRRLFSKEALLEESKRSKEDAAKKDSKMKSIEDLLEKEKRESKRYIKKAKGYEGLVKSVSEAFGDFINKVINFVKTARNPNDKSIFIKKKEALMNSKVFSEDFEDEVSKLYSDFTWNISEQKNRLKKEIEALESAENKEESKKPDKEFCYRCKNKIYWRFLNYLSKS
jgi:hypothetical protein